MPAQATRFARYAKPAAFAVLLVAGAMVAIPSSSHATVDTDPYASLPASITLNGIVRDFKWRTETGGHTDFEWQPTGGFNHYVGMAADTLDSDGKPVFASTGYKVTTQATDASSRNRMPVAKSYIDARANDRAGSVATTTGGSSHTAEAFAQWYRDVPGTNVSAQVPLTLVRQSGTNIYTFNDKTDSTYSSRGGFFPINGQLFGNSPNQSKNFGFTYELNTNFVYRRGTGQVFTFTGDDDVFVYINGKLVIDIGGVHSAVSQTIELDRLNYLQDGQRYPLQFFFAERHTTQSNFRIDTTINLENASLPATTALFD